MIAHDEGVRDSIVVLLGAMGAVANEYTFGRAFLEDQGWHWADCLLLDEKIVDIPALRLVRIIRSVQLEFAIALFGNSVILTVPVDQSGVTAFIETPLMAPGLKSFLAQVRESVPVRVRQSRPLN